MLLLDLARQDPTADVAPALALAMRSAGNVLLPFALPMTQAGDEKPGLLANRDAPLDSV